MKHCVPQIAIIASCAISLFTDEVYAQKGNSEKAPDFLTPAADRVTAKGLAFLAAQQEEDGSYLEGDVAVTALAGMAFVSGGHLPQRGKYGPQVKQIVQYLLSRSQSNGLIIGPDSDSNRIMYGHGFALLFLADVFGMVEDDTLKSKLRKGVELIVKTQNQEGGWRYTAERVESADISVTTCLIIALKAARNAGIAVPSSTIEKAMQYVKQCQNEDGGFRYQLQGSPESAFPRTAAAIVSFYSVGQSNDSQIDQAMKYVSPFKASSRLTPTTNPHFFYGHYYAVQAMWHRGGEDWANWFPAIRDQLVTLQQPEGHWNDKAQGKIYATAMACIVLQLPNQFLPIFER